MQQNMATLERSDAAARYTEKSSGANSLLFCFTGIFRRINKYHEKCYNNHKV
ncbi:MAG: hypothetical protein J6A19_15055 [Oscillospiraceae bacterium]|nr:hypothetical protein [Oscillospiraceae bacterium]